VGTNDHELGGAAMTGEALAVLALAATPLILGGEPGPARLRALVAGSSVPVLAVAGGSMLAVRAAGAAGLGLLVGAATGAVMAGVLAAGIGLALPTVVSRLGTRSSGADDPVELAAAWAQLAVCLKAGLPVAAAVVAAADQLDGGTGHTLRRVAGLLELGSDPAQAWQAAEDDPAVAAFARAAGRSAATGAALARSARVESARVRDTLTDAAEARAQRAGVLIAAPLGLCFLPAFLVLGVVPIVIGLAGEVLVPW
jgi:pilus assembly protein TadC